MKLSYRALLQVSLILSIALVSVSINQAARAATPSITVTALWHPSTQLATVDAAPIGQTNTGDDLRYVDLELDATANVQFWAMELTCTVNKTALESYAPNSDPNATGDDVPIVTWGKDWQVAQAQVVQPFNPATGAITIAAATDTNDPMGGNTVTKVFTLATIRYRVKTVTTAMTSPGSCTGSFLNTDGKPVLMPTFIMPPALNIVPFYTISGNVSYQGRAAKGGIAVACQLPNQRIIGVTAFDTTTDANGNFQGNVRVQGSYQCQFFGNLDPKNDGPLQLLYLTGFTSVPLNGLSYKLLPVTLRGGNLCPVPNSACNDPAVNIDGVTAQQVIGASDLAIVTANLGKPVTAGDINGDSKTDKSDLTIIAGNYFTDDTYPSSHILFGLTRGPAGSGSRIWLGRPWLGGLTQLIPGTNVDNWPAVSPDGSKIVVTRRLGTAPNYRYALFVMNIDGSGATQLTPITGPNGNLDAFAASWSPDGSHIAFDCGVPQDWRVNDVSLCMIDATGHSFQTLDKHVSIYPPAWLDNDKLIYAGTLHIDNPVCSDKTLCELSLSSGIVSPFDLRAGGGINIMPTITNHRIFYISGQPGPRYELRTAALDSNNVVQPFTVVAPNCLCDYYAVRPNSSDIVFTETASTTFDELIGDPSRWDGFAVEVPDAAVNPAWGGHFFDTSDIYALRNTVAWLP